MSVIQFKAPWARPLRIRTTVAVITLLILICLGAVWSPHFDVIVRMGLAIVPTVILIVGLSRIVRGYTLTADAVVIKRMFTTTHLPLADIQSVEGKADAMQRAVPLLATCGLFTYAGWYWKRRLGLYRAYATDPSRTVVIRQRSRKIVITPHDPQQFIARARTLIKVGSEWG